MRVDKAAGAWMLSFLFFCGYVAYSQSPQDPPSLPQVNNQELVERLKLAAQWCDNRDCQIKLGKCLLHTVDVRICFADSQ
jgi:hypothetical protein